MSAADILADVIELHEGEARRRADRVFTIAALPTGHCKAALDHASIAAMREQVERMRRGMAEFDPADTKVPMKLETVIVDAFVARMRELLVSVRQGGTA